MADNERKPGLTDYRYGGHSGVSPDPDPEPRSAEDTRPRSHDNEPPAPYVPQPGANEPAGVERYGMYGVAPGAGAPAPIVDTEPRPVPGPAALGQFDGDDMRAVSPLSARQRLEVLDERLATLVDPGTVKAEVDEDDALVLRGTVRDAATRDGVERAARETFPDCTLRSEVSVGTR